MEDLREDQWRHRTKRVNNTPDASFRKCLPAWYQWDKAEMWWELWVIIARWSTQVGLMGTAPGPWHINVKESSQLGKSQGILLLLPLPKAAEFSLEVTTFWSHLLITWTNVTCAPAFWDKAFLCAPLWLLHWLLRCVCFICPTSLCFQGTNLFLSSLINHATWHLSIVQFLKTSAGQLYIYISQKCQSK